MAIGSIEATRAPGRAIHACDGFMHLSCGGDVAFVILFGAVGNMRYSVYLRRVSYGYCSILTHCTHVHARGGSHLS